MPLPGSKPIIILIGLPGSGKSTWAHQFIVQCPRYRIVSTDTTRAQLYGDEAIQGSWHDVWRHIQQSLRASLETLEAGQLDGVIYDATNARRRHRRQFIQYLQRLGYGPLGAIWFDRPLSICLERNAQRHRQVPEAVICRMQRQLQGAPPDVAEGLAWLVRWRESGV